LIARRRRLSPIFERALRAGGSGLNRVAKVTIYLTDMTNFPKIVELRRCWFSRPYPADTIVEVSGLYSPDAMIEIEAIAVVDGDKRSRAARLHRQTCFTGVA